MSDVTMTGDALAYGWRPHAPETWTYRFASLRKWLVMQHYAGRWVDGEPEMRTVNCEAGTRVKIVMVSRFGDVGITEDLTADNGYGARVMLDDLCDFEASPCSAPAAAYQQGGQ